MEDVWSVVLRVGAAWVALVFTLIVLPSALGVSLGISETYLWILVKTLEVGGGRRPLKRVGGPKMASPVRCRLGPAGGTPGGLGLPTFAVARAVSLRPVAPARLCLVPQESWWAPLPPAGGSVIAPPPLPWAWRPRGQIWGGGQPRETQSLGDQGLGGEE